MKELTDKQKEYYFFIAEFIDENEYPPSMREIAISFNVTVRNVIDHLRRIQAKGYIDWQPKRCRTIIILKEIKILKGEEND